MNDQNRLNQHLQRLALHSEVNARPTAPHSIQRLIA